MGTVAENVVAELNMLLFVEKDEAVAPNVAFCFPKVAET